MLGYVSGLLSVIYQVDTATNGAEALRAAEARPPDLVLTDVMMPELDGFGLLSALRANPRTSSIPVILLSARAGEESCSEGMDAAADDYLVKPFSARELLARVGAHLRLSRARNEAEIGRRQSEERLSFALRAGGGVGTWDWDIPNDLVYSDTKFAAFFSIDPQRAAAGTPIADYVARIHPDDRSRVEAQIERALKTDAEFFDEYRVVRADGTERWLQARGKCHRDDGGKPLRFPGVVFDISAQKKVEKDLRHANIDLQQFAFAAAHDLQEPLRMVTTYTQLLSRKLSETLDEDGRQYVTQVVGGAKRMSALLRDLLAYTDASRDQDEDRTAVDLNSVFTNVVSNLHDRIRENGAKVEAEPLPTVVGYQVHFIQLFQNLISNSLKYRGEVPPEVHVSAQRNATEWTLRFRDNGLGIAVEHQDRVFGVFKRLHGKEIPGTGIGLAICQRVVERHGGRLWVESKGKGHGSTFCFTLPLMHPGVVH